MLNSSALNVRFVNNGMTHFMSNLMQWMVSGGASELHLRVGMSRLEEVMRTDRYLSIEAKCVLPRGLRRTLFLGQKTKWISHSPRIGGVEKMKNRLSVFPKVFAAITTAAVCLGCPGAPPAPKTVPPRVTAPLRRLPPALLRSLPCPMARAK